MQMNHFNVSMVKSGLRIFACLLLMCQWFILAGFFLILAEGLGIFEEMVDYD
jgi:hypothetical protein